MTDVIVTTHTGQLSRIGGDMVMACEDSSVFGQLKIFKWFIYAGEFGAAAFGLYHLTHGINALSIGAFCLEVTLIIVHVITSSVEKQLHINHERRVQSLSDELMEKEDDMLGTAEAFNVRVRRWYHRARRPY